MSDAAARDDRPATSLRRYVWLMSGPHQLALAALAVATAALHLAPIELQRRLVDNAIAVGDLERLWLLGGLYALALLAHQGVKLGLGVYQAWVAERTVAYTRRHLYGLRATDSPADGELVSILNGEVDKLGGFVGEGPSKATVNSATLLGVLGYMTVVSPQIALVAAGLLTPQVCLTPVVQRRLNVLIQRRLTLLRRLGDHAAAGDHGARDTAGLITSVLRNRLRYTRLKLAMKAALNLLNGAAPLVILLWGGLLVIDGQATLGVLLAFVTGFTRMADPIRELIAFYRQAAQARVQHAMIAKWMDRALDRALDKR